MPAVQSEIEQCVLDGVPLRARAARVGHGGRGADLARAVGTLMRTSDEPLRMAVCRGGTHYWIPRTRAASQQPSS